MKTTPDIIHLILLIALGITLLILSFVYVAMTEYRRQAHGNFYFDCNDPKTEKTYGMLCSLLCMDDPRQQIDYLIKLTAEERADIGEAILMSKTRKQNILKSIKNISRVCAKQIGPGVKVRAKRDYDHSWKHDVVWTGGYDIEGNFICIQGWESTSGARENKYEPFVIIDLPKTTQKP